MNGSVSVIIPTMNRRDLLRQALGSLAVQTRPCMEAVVIDAGADGSEAVAREFAFVRYVRQSTKGLTAARNEALTLVNGDYVGMLDSDDLYDAGFLAACAAALDQDPGVAVAYSRGRVIDADGRVLGRLLDGHRSPRDTLRALLRDNFVIASFALMRSSAVRAVGGYDDRLTWADDYDLFLRIAMAGGRFVHVSEALASRRRHEGSLTAAFPTQNLDAIRDILERHSDAIRRCLGGGRAWWMAGPHYRLGRALLDGGRPDEARVCFGRALAADPANAHIRLYLHWCRWYALLNPPLSVARSLKRAATRALCRVGLMEARWNG